MSLMQNIESRQAVFKVKELADLLQVTPAHIYKLISRGILPSLRVAGAIRIDPSEVAAWLRERRPDHRTARTRHRHQHR